MLKQCRQGRGKREGPVARLLQVCKGGAQRAACSPRCEIPVAFSKESHGQRSDFIHRLAGEEKRDE